LDTINHQSVIPNHIRSLCVYCGSATGNDIQYTSAARSLAAALVNHKIDLIYGGGKVGLMGIIADEVMRLGGQVTGVIPQALLNKEVGHQHLTQLHVVSDMHERKAMMTKLSDGFIAMAGGLGTLEELFEMLTWSQLGIHDKPIGVLNTDGFYDGLIKFSHHLVDQGFLRRSHADLMMHEVDPGNLIKRMLAFVPDRATKILNL
jgi:uncharacterized protein (TIGR00730 family)